MSVRNVVRSPELERDAGQDLHTYRGATLEELLPQIREELGPDAIVLRQREGLNGGFAGFFQRRCVEVVARRAAPGVDAYDEREDGATDKDAAGRRPRRAARRRDAVEPVAGEPPVPGIQEIMRVASPFIDQLRAAEDAAEPAATLHPFEPPRLDDQPVTGAYGASAYAVTANGALAAAAAPVAAPVLALAPDPTPLSVAVPAPEPDHARLPVAVPAPDPALALDPASAFDIEPVAVAVPVARSGAAATHERALIAAGLAPERAAELLDATVSHDAPFAPKRALKHLVRDALAHRIPCAAPVAAGGRAIAFVGAGGSGKTLCASRLATAYARHSDLRVTVMNLAAPERGGELADLVAPVGLYPYDARARGTTVACDTRVMTVVDTPAVSPGEPELVAALAGKLERMGAPEVHVAVPATLSGPAVRALLDGLAPLHPDAIVLTHLDEVAHAGAVIDEAIARAIPISYTSDAGGFGPVDAAALAARVLP